MAHWSLWRNVLVNSKITQTMQNTRNSLSESQIYKKWKISDSNLETGRKSSKTWSLLDYMGEWTALRRLLRSFSHFTLSLYFNPSMQSSSCIFELFFWKNSSYVSGLSVCIFEALWLCLFRCVLQGPTRRYREHTSASWLWNWLIIVNAEE